MPSKKYLYQGGPRTCLSVPAEPDESLEAESAPLIPGQQVELSIRLQNLSLTQRFIRQGQLIPVAAPIVAAKPARSRTKAKAGGES